MSSSSFASRLSSLRQLARSFGSASLGSALLVSPGSRLFAFVPGSSLVAGLFARSARQSGFAIAVGRCPSTGVWLVGVGSSVSGALFAVRGLRGCAVASRVPSVVRVWSPLFSGFLGFGVGLGRARSVCGRGWVRPGSLGRGWFWRPLSRRRWPVLCAAPSALRRVPRLAAPSVVPVRLPFPVSSPFALVRFLLGSGCRSVRWFSPGALRSSAVCRVRFSSFAPARRACSLLGGSWLRPVSSGGGWVLFVPFAGWPGLRPLFHSLALLARGGLLAPHDLVLIAIVRFRTLTDCYSLVINFYPTKKL